MLIAAKIKVFKNTFCNIASKTLPHLLNPGDAEARKGLPTAVVLSLDLLQVVRT